MSTIPYKNCTKLFGFATLLLAFQSAHSGIQATQKQDTPLLQRNSSVKRELPGGGKHTASVSLSPGQYFHLDIEQQGIDVATTVFYPDGKQVEFDTPSGANGTESVRFIADGGGTYKLEFRSLLVEVDPGHYRAKVILLRDATAHCSPE